MTKTFDFECSECPFASTGWATKELRDLRKKQHLDEHETGEPMQELHEFRVENGVDV